MKDLGKKFFYILVSVAIFFAFFLAMVLLVRPSGYALQDGWIIEHRNEIARVKLPYTQQMDSDLEVVAFRNTFPKSVGDALVIPRPSSHAIRVFINGSRVYSIGDMNAPTSNLWNSILIIPLPENLLENNIIEIELSSASSAVGLLSIPYIEWQEAISSRLLIAQFIYNDSLLVAMGASFSIGLILILLSRMRDKSYNAEFYLGLAAVFCALYCFDYIYRDTSGTLTHFLVMKKILLISGYMGMLCFGIGLEKKYYNQLHISRFLVVPTLFSVIAFALAGSLRQFSDMLNYLNMLMLVNLVVAVFLILRNQNDKYFLIIPAALLILSISQGMLVMVYRLDWPFVMQHMVLWGAIFFGVNLIIEFTDLYSTNRELQRQTNLDPLTGAYNRRILDNLPYSAYSLIIMADLNGFKAYNDQHGHPAGDEMLVKFVQISRQNLRSRDLVVRYGGDEFVYLLQNTGERDARRIVERINRQLCATCSEGDISFAYGIVPIRDSISESLARADQQMYKMKRSEEGHTRR